MRRMFYKSMLLATIFLFVMGCHMLEKMYLKSPTKAPSQELEEFKRIPAPNEFMDDLVQDMMGRIAILMSATHISNDISLILEECLSFLEKEFGPPVYQGRVFLYVTDVPTDNAYILWQENDDRERQIILNHYNIMKPRWHYYLVHELFHAFYQSSSFLKISPDSIIEGLAIYAQYKYQNPEMSNDQIKEKIYEDAVALYPYSNREGIDFDRSFQSYGEGERKYIYLVCGLLFFSQDPASIKEKIRKLLRSPQFSDEKVPFERIVKLYDLTIKGDMFEQTEKKELVLPKPTALPLDLGANISRRGYN